MPDINGFPLPADIGDLLPQLSLQGRRLCLVRDDSATHQRVVRFIQCRFLQAYGARPQLRVPQLLALMHPDGRIAAAVGVRHAASERLFLEDYLTAPVETRVPDKPQRTSIVEVAHLAGVEPGVSRFLFPMLTVWLTRNAVQWICFTGTAPLRNSFARLGLATQVLGAVDPARLPDAGRGWGRYYDNAPEVMAAHVPSGHAVLARHGLLGSIHDLTGAGGGHERTA